jgi:hypothetical protein
LKIRPVVGVAVWPDILALGSWALLVVGADIINVLFFSTKVINRFQTYATVTTSSYNTIFLLATQIFSGALACNLTCSFSFELPTINRR